MTTITVKTESNFKNCNDKQLEVLNFLGSIIVAKVPFFGFDANGNPQGEMISADFSIKEIIKINN
jgi:hypothetical protein